MHVYNLVAGNQQLVSPVHDTVGHQQVISFSEKSVFLIFFRQKFNSNPLWI